MEQLSALQSQFPRPGRVEWIGLRAERKQPLQSVQEVETCALQGLQGDHYSGRTGKRHLTIIDAAHLLAVAQYMGVTAINPADLRRNIVVSGVNLRALKQRRFQLGSVLAEYTDPCHPCSRMEEVLGPGGYNAMRGHGGICARVLEAGVIRVGDALTAVYP